jgi:hypothetical protein
MSEKGCIVWDVPYTAEYNDYFVESENYVIRVHKKLGLLSPEVNPQPFRENITKEQRALHVSVGETLKL